MNGITSDPVVPRLRGKTGPLGIGLIVAVGALVLIGLSISGTYNRLVKLDQAVQVQWAQVENAYQRRADLVLALVATVKGAAGFEQQTLLAVTQARAQVQEPKGGVPARGELEEYQRSQDQLGSALTRLMVVVEAYPQLKATESFRDLQAQLEGTENRIATERMRFNQAAQEFNTTRSSFPTTIFAGMFGARFEEKAYFQSRPDAQLTPAVVF